MSASEVLASAMYAELDEHRYEDDDEKRGQVAHHFAAHQLDALKAAGYEVFHVRAECAHCGEPIKYEPDFKLWFHPSSGIEHCYRAPEHTEVATPKHVAEEMAQ